SSTSCRCAGVGADWLPLLPCRKPDRACACRPRRVRAWSARRGQRYAVCEPARACGCASGWAHRRLFGPRTQSRAALQALLLVGADQLSLAQHVPFHGRDQISLGRPLQIAEHAVERIQLEEVPMLTYRRAGATVPGALPVVLSIVGTRGR